MAINCSTSFYTLGKQLYNIKFSQPKHLTEGICEIPVSFKNILSNEVPFIFSAPTAKFIKGSLCGKNSIVLLYGNTSINLKFCIFVEKLYNLAFNHVLRLFYNITKSCPIINNIQAGINPISFKIKIPKRIKNLPDCELVEPLIQWKKIAFFYGKIIMWCELIDENELSTRIQCMYRLWKAKKEFNDLSEL